MKSPVKAVANVGGGRALGFQGSGRSYAPPTTRERLKPLNSDWETGIPGPVTVYQQEPITEDTGLLDSMGNLIYAVDGPEPVGFHLNQWKDQ